LGFGRAISGQHTFAKIWSYLVTGNIKKGIVSVSGLGNGPPHVAAWSLYSIRTFLKVPPFGFTSKPWYRLALHLE
jgi:hypothetical protein